MKALLHPRAFSPADLRSGWLCHLNGLSGDAARTRTRARSHHHHRVASPSCRVPCATEICRRSLAPSSCVPTWMACTSARSIPVRFLSGFLPPCYTPAQRSTTAHRTFQRDFLAAIRSLNVVGAQEVLNDLVTYGPAESLLRQGLRLGALERGDSASSYARRQWRTGPYVCFVTDHMHAHTTPLDERSFCISTSSHPTLDAPPTQRSGPCWMGVLAP